MSSARGNLGEHVIMAELMHRDFHAFMADRNNPAFDAMSLWPETGRRCALRVKTTSNHSAVWTVKRKTGSIFLDLQGGDDFVLIVDIGSGLRDRDIYVVPTGHLLDVLEADHTFYVSHPKKNGEPRKAEQGMRCIRFHGENKPTDHGWGYQDKFAEYREAWDLLK
ncbi:hypothetical protein [Sphingomicrobium arenosum]|uniref:hypothetical protein n=1 Tax=Sphingomicrobium arenosum TaxID=2233861 RepID=UPI002240B99C|nr:hypothetical protein [Sphingomicrobium arenosum]